MPVAIVTGASRGLGRALATGLAREGWSVVIDARTPDDLMSAHATIAAAARSGAAVRAVPGDVTSPLHRLDLVQAAEELGGLDLIVNNAGTLGPSPLPELTGFPIEGLRDAFEANVVAPLALIQEGSALLDRSGRPTVINVTSDASVVAYPGWGGYGGSKAALDQISAVLAVERPGWRVWAVDPGDMRTRMHQDAFPGEDISDRPEPSEAVPGLLKLIGSDRPSGRVKLSELADHAGVAAVQP